MTDHLKAHRDKVAQQKLDGTYVAPVIDTRNIVQKSIDQKLSPMKAIKAFCSSCMGMTADSTEPGLRESIRDCTAGKCPLYRHRPYQDFGSSDEVA
jgi:hypothetical protein